jgi:hypothetical protein
MTRRSSPPRLRDSPEWRVFEYLSQELGLASDQRREAAGDSTTQPRRRPAPEVATNPE